MRFRLPLPSLFIQVPPARPRGRSSNCRSPVIRLLWPPEVCNCGWVVFPPSSKFGRLVLNGTAAGRNQQGLQRLFVPLEAFHAAAIKTAIRKCANGCKSRGGAICDFSASCCKARRGAKEPRSLVALPPSPKPPAACLMRAINEKEYQVRGNAVERKGGGPGTPLLAFAPASEEGDTAVLRVEHHNQPPSPQASCPPTRAVFENCGTLAGALARKQDRLFF